VSIKSWKILDSKEIFRSKYATFKADRCELPSGRVMPEYYIWEFPDWVNIVPVTKEGDIVLIKQYRHALGEVTWEIPGGAMDKEDSGPQEAALRELVEETGYSSKDLFKVAKHSPNPAIQNNWMHTFLAKECEKTQEQDLDTFEDIEVCVFSKNKVKEMILDEEIHHSIVVASLLVALEHI
jgi:ADP-ribose pyrophosphatase